ncbi:MAG TPA: hypothetical protein VKQ70_04305 [Caulobacteraceae bacterium]|jgi:hypothetical protein|nr:hypothetical protein [Caulobacteraceae bacterium]
MDLLERYLDTVRLFLPLAQRDDIAAELRDVLLTRCEEREAELGRPLNRAEQEAVLKGFGHPLVVAARYGRQQYLIGPDLYPAYRFVVLLVLGVLAFSAAVAGGVQTAAGIGGAFAGLGTALKIIWEGAFVAIGAVTFTFAALQRTGVGQRMLRDWSVAELPHLSLRRRRERWFEPLAGMVVLTIVLLWWVGLIQGWPPAIPVKPGGVIHLAFAPQLHDLYFPVLALLAGGIAVDGLKLAGRETRAIALSLDIVLQAAMIAVVGLALHAGHWVVVTGEGVPAQALAATGYGVEIGAKVTLIVWICAGVLAVVLNAWRLLRPEPEKGPQARHAANGA